MRKAPVYILGLTTMGLGFALAFAAPGWATPLTSRVNVSSSGEQALPSGNSLGGLSRDGRYVVFASNAENLVPGDTNGVRDVFVHDRETRITRRVSVSSSGHQAERPSGWARISADGGFVVFRSRAGSLVGRAANRRRHIYVHDLATRQTTCVSVNSAGERANANSNFPDISGDGRFVVFNTLATNLANAATRANDGPGTSMNVYRNDRRTDTTTLVSRDPWRGPPHNYSGSASIGQRGLCRVHVAYRRRCRHLWGVRVQRRAEDDASLRPLPRRSQLGPVRKRDRALGYGPVPHDT
jgi:Tol biopolymer transport system component